MQVHKHGPEHATYLSVVLHSIGTIFIIISLYIQLCRGVGRCWRLWGHKILIARVARANFWTTPTFRKNHTHFCISEAKVWTWDTVYTKTSRLMANGNKMQ